MHIEEDLRQVNDPLNLADDTGCVNKETGCNQNDLYLVTDEKGKLIIDTGVNPPNNRVNYPFKRLFYTGDAFLAALDVREYTFVESGKYLVHCINRGHFITDWMFGFVNVVDCDDVNDVD